MVASAYKELRPISDLGEYLEQIFKQKEEAIAAGHKEDFVFRGQRVDWPLIARVGRAEKESARKRESLLFDEFKRTCPPHVQSHDDWDLLAIAQHHGLATRLIDWTYSALNALWFAVGQPPHEEHERHSLRFEKKGVMRRRDGVVWMMRLELNDFADTAKNPLQLTTSRVHRPRVVARRIEAQAGIFVVHAPQYKDNFFIPLEKNSIFTKRLMKIPVPHASFAKLQQQLQSCGINSYTAYPDLAGLCDHLNWRYLQ